MATWTQFKFQDAAGATGNGSALALDHLQGRMLAVQVVISNTATVTFEGTVDGTNWTSIAGLKRSDMATFTAAPTASEQYLVDVGGLTSFRARVSAWTSGTVTVMGNAFIG